MTALPSILAGLFIYAAWILAFGFEQSGLAAALALSVMMLPYIIRAADLALRLVPGNLREAAAALGAPGWRGELAGRAAHGPVGSGHRGHPGHRPGHRRGLTGPPHRRLHHLHQRQPAQRADGVAARWRPSSWSRPACPPTPAGPSGVPRSCCWWSSSCSWWPARSAGGARATCRRRGQRRVMAGLGPRRGPLRPAGARPSVRRPGRPPP